MISSCVDMQSLQPVRTLPLLLTHKQKEGARSGDNHVCVNVDRLVLTSTRVLAPPPARPCPAPATPPHLQPCLGCGDGANARAMRMQWWPFKSSSESRYSSVFYYSDHQLALYLLNRNIQLGRAKIYSLKNASSIRLVFSRHNKNISIYLSTYISTKEKNLSN